MSQAFVKDPNAVLDYHINWGDWLAGDSIATSSWIVPSGIVKDSDTNTSTATTVWLSGGSLGQAYALVNRIVTTGGRTEDRTIRVQIWDK